MATISARRRPIRDDAERKNEFTCRISPILSAPAETIVSRRKARNQKMVPPPARVETAAQIATRASSGRWLTVDLLPRSGRQRSKSSLTKIPRAARCAGPEALRRCKPERAFETLGVVRPDLGIDEARWPLAVEGIENLLGGDPAHIFPRFPGHTGRVRAHQHVIELQQRMVRRRRLLGPDVEARSRDRFVAQCFKQCCFIMDKAPRLVMK
jgi:hypothetical protein